MTTRTSRCVRAAIATACFWLVFTPAPIRADDSAPSQQSLQAKREADFQSAAAAAQEAAIAGPKDVPLGKKGVLHLPQGYLFVPQPQAGTFSHALGNGNSERLVGIAADQKGSGWLAYIEYLDDGHVNDADAKTWNADELLQNLKDGTEAGNEERISRGFEPIEVAGWIEPPAYDAAAHRLVWSAHVRQKSAQSGGSANYNTYALGREGHFELNLVSPVDKIEGFKADAKTLLAAMDFNEGQRYADYNPKTDKLAEYGLAALIGGVAAKKLGLLALAAGFAAKFFKLIALAAVVGAGAALRRMFSRSPRG
jgi:uncharacterized membrane-anchored protein